MKDGIVFKVLLWRKVMNNIRKNITCIETAILKKYELKISKNQYVVLMLKDTDGVISIETESYSEGLSVYEKSRNGKFICYRRILNDNELNGLCESILAEYLTDRNI